MWVYDHRGYARPTDLGWSKARPESSPRGVSRQGAHRLHSQAGQLLAEAKSIPWQL